MSETGRETARRVAARLRDAGWQSWLVGGCVRDRLLGRPVKDFDLATDAPPEAVMGLFPGAKAVGAHFGVVLAGEGESQIQVATYRSDDAYLDGRRPESVRFETDIRADLARRDFTINALIEDPFTGEVFDHVGGRADLAAGLIRAIGDPAARFAEDYLRMLRAVRFAARLGFAIEPASARAISARADSIAAISAERVRDELTRILTEGGARRGFELLDELGLLAVLLPEVAAMKGVAQPPEFHPEGDVWVHTLRLLENLGASAPELAWAALLHDVGKPPTFRLAERIRFDGHVEKGVEMAEAILRRLRLSTGEITRTLALIAQHMRWRDLERMKESTLKRFLRLPDFDLHLELHRLDCLASHRSLVHYDYAVRRRAALGEEAIRPAPLLRGADLIEAGYAPGPLFKRILTAVEDAQLEGRAATREEALALARALAGGPESSRGEP
jgi:poly(A) polymerase